MIPLTKEKLLETVRQYHPVPIQVAVDSLKMSWGFTRLSGLEISLTKLIKPSATEESLSVAPKDELLKNFQAWCKENNLIYVEQPFDEVLICVNPTP